MLINSQPSLRVCQLKIANSVRRWPLAGAAIGISLVVIGIFVGSGVGDLALHPVAVFSVTLVLFSLIIFRRRQKLSRHRQHDWLAPLPHDTPLTARAAYLPFFVWACGALVVLVTAFSSAVSIKSGGGVILSSGIGFIGALPAAALAASLDRRRKLRQRYRERSYTALPASQYAVVRRPRERWATSTSMAPIGYWPTAQARFLERPKIRVRTLALYLLAVPLDAAAAIVVAGAVLWLITMHLFSLLAATVRVAFSAAWWLTPTPIGTSRFAIAVCHRALLGEVVGCGILIGIADGLGGRRLFHSALWGALLWTAAVCIVSATASLLALRSVPVARSTLHRWMA